MLEFLINLSKEAGEYILNQSSEEILVEHKGRIDLVTNADKASQGMIIKSIVEKFPDHAIIAEEGYDKQGKDGFAWYIDPIDGTTNFVHGVPMFCVSIALYKDASPVIGVCHNPSTRETFHAEKGKGAFLNGMPIYVSRTENLLDSLVATGFPYKSENMDKIIQCFFNVVGNVQGIRRFGSAALDLCYVACGRFDAFWEMGLKPWDMAAGVLILNEAGGKITGMNGADFDLHKGDIVATNKIIHDDFLKIM
ncbi:MAG TPA: inositol monophosphatase family protein [Desulfomonilia bacterium]